MKWIADDDSLAIFFEVNDKQLDRIRNDKDYFKDDAFVVSCENEHGNNAFFFKLHNNGDIKKVNKHIALLLNRYDTISWWGKDRSVFKIKRRTICHK